MISARRTRMSKEPSRFPCLTPEHETTIRNMFIGGELGGLALIKNGVNQGRDCVDDITKRLDGMLEPAAAVHHAEGVAQFRRFRCFLSFKRTL